MKLSKDFFNSDNSIDFKIGDIISFKRSEYEANKPGGISDAEYVQKWNEFTAKISQMMKFKLMPAKFDPNGNGISVIVTRSNLAPIN